MKENGGKMNYFIETMEKIKKYAVRQNELYLKKNFNQFVSKIY